MFNVVKSSWIYNYRSSNSHLLTLILPMIDYGDVLYDGVNSILQKKLQTLQN